MGKISKARYWAIATTVGGIVVATAVVANNVSSTLNNIFNLRKQSTTTTASVSSASVPPPLPKAENKQPLRANPAAPAKAPLQISTGDQSPNIRNTKKAVRLEYRGAPATKDASQANVQPISILKASSVQVSTGVQSPNIDGAAGDVDIKYLHAAPAEGKSEQAQNAQN